MEILGPIILFLIILGVLAINYYLQARTEAEEYFERIKKK